MSQNVKSQSSRKGHVLPPLKTVNQSISLAVKFGTVLYPIDGAQFARAIAGEGFILPDAMVGPNIQVGGLEARKGKVALRIDAARLILGVSAPDPKTAVSEMESIESLVKREFGVDCSSLAHFYELVANSIIPARRSPLDSWRQHFSGSALLDQFSEALGFGVSPFGLRFARSSEEPTQAGWFEARIEPQIPNSHRQHYINIVFRDPQREVVYSFVRGFEETLAKLVSLVEQE